MAALYEGGSSYDGGNSTAFLCILVRNIKYI